MKLTRRTAFLGAAAFCAAQPMAAYAHKEKATVSKIEWSEKDGYLYATHIFHIHDTEVTLFKAGITHSAKFESLRARAQLALYVQDAFKLASLEGEPIELEVLGAEIEGRDVYVYQQAKLRQAPSGLIVNCNLLRKYVPTQINHVDVNLAGQTRSLTFRGEDGPKKALA